MSEQPAQGELQLIACTLSADDANQRVNEWRAVLANVVSREAINGGVRLTFGANASVATIAELARAEQSCCGFFRFAITIDERGTALEVIAPDAAAELVAALFGRLP